MGGKSTQDAPPAGDQVLAPPSSSALENLPAELRDLILRSAPDIPTLRALVHASPVMHAQYVSNRDNILRACVGHELDAIYIHAYACGKSRAINPAQVRNDEAMTDFRDAYRAWLAPGWDPRAVIDELEPTDMQWLVTFHLSVARPLTRMYGKWALENLARGVDDQTEQHQGQRQDTTLSRSEEIRIMRAVYQCQTFQHLFGRNGAGCYRFYHHHEVNSLFLANFDPWEAEAIGCVDRFLRERYKLVIEQVRHDLPRPEEFDYLEAPSDGEAEDSASEDEHGIHKDPETHCKSPYNLALTFVLTQCLNDPRLYQ